MINVTEVQVVRKVSLVPYKDTESTEEVMTAEEAQLIEQYKNDHFMTMTSKYPFSS